MSRAWTLAFAAGMSLAVIAAPMSCVSAGAAMSTNTRGEQAVSQPAQQVVEYGGPEGWRNSIGPKCGSQEQPARAGSPGQCSKVVIGEFS